MPFVMSEAYAPIKSKLQNPPPPPPQAILGYLPIFCAWRVGNFRGKAFPRVGNLTIASVAWEKLNRQSQVSNDLFFFGRRTR